MKYITLKILSILLVTVLSFTNSFAQNVNQPDCNIFSTSPFSSSPEIVGGNLKPERSDLSGGLPALSTSFFPMMVVFVQYQNETQESADWPIGQPPVYLNSLLSEIKFENPNWWQSYNDQTQAISSYWMEASRGKFHVLGKAYSIILDHNESYYVSNDGQDRINAEVYEKLKQIPGIEWLNYDKWSKNPIDGKFYYQRDNLIDMICMVHRTVTPAGAIGNYQGYVPLGTANFQYNYLVDSLNNVRINGSYSSDGSGLKVNGKFGPVSQKTLMNIMTHEFGHYLFGSGHTTYSVMAKGPGSEFFISPWERVKLGYTIPTTIDFNNFTFDYNLNDYSGRNFSNGEILQVPISTNNSEEFFLIANRRKVSRWDRLMQGDTAHDDPLKIINPEYGKGVYIYHIKNGYSYPYFDLGDAMDLECADGLYNWTETGVAAPDWDPNHPWLPIFNKLSVSRENDNGFNGINGKDGMNVESPTIHQGKWIGEGKKESVANGDGTDRMYTNNQNPWTSRELKGDRYDAWNIGYNQVFSPYSSPSTKDWNNNNTGIFIYYNSLNGDIANIKIYRTGYGNFQTEDQILAVTPPSRPMGLNVDNYIYNNKCYPKLTWDHNMEPDMLRSNGKKQYKIFRSEARTLDYVPVGPGYLIATIEIPANEIPSYVDLNILKADCLQYDSRNPYGVLYPARYRVQAVDNSNTSSVLSDFKSTIGVRNGTIKYEWDNTSNNENNSVKPESFSLKQNFPNPFNPKTNIQFEIPNDEVVKIRIYDLLGKEVASIVNEFKVAGSYIVGFDGSKLSSGIYYYKINAGEFEEIRKMILLK